MSTRTLSHIPLKPLLAAFLLSFALMVAPVAGQEAPGSLQRIGLLGGGLSDDVRGTTLALGGMKHAGTFTVTAVAEGFFYQGRPDARFQEIPMLVVRPEAPNQIEEDVACADQDTGEVFSYGECVASKISASAMLDVSLRRQVGSHQMLVGVGYRAGSASEPFIVLGFSGASTADQAGWLARLAVGQRTVGLQVGFAGIG